MVVVNKKYRKGLNGMKRINSNMEIREAMKEAGLSQWQLAELLNCHENTVLRKLRSELPEEEKLHLLDVIEKYRKEGEAGGTVEGQ